MKFATVLTFFFMTKLSYGVESDSYHDRDHQLSETALNITGAYAASWGVFYLTQWNHIREVGSIKKYKQNIGRLDFDQDEPFWNWAVHPYSGSQLYLFYRAKSYSQKESLLLTSISATLFESTIEIVTEPASIQDLYQTPILGTLLGYAIESISMPLINSNNLFLKSIGHIMNPNTLMWYYEGKNQKITFIPSINYFSKTPMFSIRGEF